VSALRQLVREFRAAVARFEPSSLAASECAVLADELARAAKVCETASARAAARAVKCGGTEASIAESVARAGGRSLGATRAAIAVVKEVESCPATRDALHAGELSLAQAQEIASVPAHEQELLGVARSCGLRGLKERARKLKLDDTYPDELHDKQHAAQRVQHWQDELGMTCFAGALPPEIGVAFVNRLDAETTGSGRPRPRTRRGSRVRTTQPGRFLAWSAARGLQRDGRPIS